MRGNIAQLMQQAQKMQENLQRAQEELANLEVTGNAGGGMVTVTLSGKGDLKRLAIDPSLVDPAEKEVLEDLIVAAFNDAKLKVEQHVAEETQKLMGGMKLPPGMKLPF